jgi:hypothetical protein
MVDLQKRSLVAKIAGGLVAAPAVFTLARGFVFAQGTRSPQGAPQQPPQPGTPVQDPALTPDLKLDPKTTLKRNQAQIRDDVEKLYALALELRTQVETTETTQVLSLPMIQKAEQIEKLAKQVKTLARD